VHCIQHVLLKKQINNATHSNKKSTIPSKHHLQRPEHNNKRETAIRTSGTTLRHFDPHGLRTWERQPSSRTALSPLLSAALLLLEERVLWLVGSEVSRIEVATPSGNGKKAGGRRDVRVDLWAMMGYIFRFGFRL
jgi:hypothetical protein